MDFVNETRPCGSGAMDREFWDYSNLEIFEIPDINNIIMDYKKSIEDYEFNSYTSDIYSIIETLDMIMLDERDKDIDYDDLMLII